MPPRLLVLFVLTACASRPPRSTEPVANAAPGVPASTPARVTPLTLAELEYEGAPATADQTTTMLHGTWDGYEFPLDTELGGPTKPPVPFRPQTLTFDAYGRLTKIVEDEDDADDDDASEQARRAQCKPLDRTYLVEDDPDMGLIISVTNNGGCPGDSGFGAPYTYVLRVHRLDEQFLVLVDGVTGAVTGYRRR